MSVPGWRLERAGVHQGEASRSGVHQEGGSRDLGGASLDHGRECNKVRNRIFGREAACAGNWAAASGGTAELYAT